ncbi:hypothetical protein BgAZ_404850 [Babesia gibsoni]|uniref:Uncharacterized protein n=1 Tax=Babesia gibsoni TaxID=33632 RepID=A0AAD8P8D1_BABGI|nr:hypothetical protein BgAZ_404850 [Babesia gibsoni]
MEPQPLGIYDGFRNFPPLYTEQINDVTLSKQLAIWESFIRSSFGENELFTINVDDNDHVPFKNTVIQRMISRNFMILIAQHMVERGYAYYYHKIKSYCKTHGCSIWGSLFISKKFRASILRNIHDEECIRISSSVGESENAISTLKVKRDLLIDHAIAIGVFGKTIEETANDVLTYIKTQISANQVETPYYLFLGERDATKPFRLWPEEHIAIIISTLAMQKRILVTSCLNDDINTLDSKHVGLQYTKS